MRKRSKTTYSENPPKIMDTDEFNFNENSKQILDSNIQWSREDSEKLIDEISQQIPENDKNAYYHRISKLDWSKINIDNHSNKDCIKHLNNLLKNVRHVRILSELLDEVKFNLTNVKVQLSQRNLSAFNLFCRDFKNTNTLQSGDKFFSKASKLYKSLTEDDVEKYQNMAKQLKLTNQSKKNIRKTPFQIYLMSNTSHSKDIYQLKLDYKNLDNEEKTKWIEKAVEEIDSSMLTLSKNEKLLLKNKGKPKRPLSAYTLFMKDLCQGNKSIAFKNISLHWNLLDDEKKNVYIKKASELKLRYERDVALHKAKIKNLELEKSLLNNSTDNITEENINEAMNNKTDAMNKHALATSISCTEKSDTKLTRKKTNSLSSQDSFPSKILNKKLNTNDNSIDKSITSPVTVVSKRKQQKGKSTSAVENKTISDDLVVDIKRESSPFVLTPAKKRKLISSSFNTNSNTADESELSSTALSPSKKNIKKKQHKGSDNSENENASIKSPTSEFELKTIYEPEKPPSKPQDYFIKYMYKGKKKKSKQAYQNLSIDEKKKIKKLHAKCIEKYISDLNEYLSTLTKEEMLMYAEKTKQESDSLSSS